MRKALPIHEGDKVPESTDALKQAILQITGSEATDIAGVCCDDKGQSMVYIGLNGKSHRAFQYNPVPKGATRFPPDVIKLYDEEMDAVFDAVKRGDAGEDDSKGYALSNDPKLRSKQLAMRDYALRHEELILQALESADAKQRIAASALWGYAQQSKKQIVALVRASRDPDSTVRNNAIRVLDVLCSSNPKIAAEIPVSEFVPMLFSGSWTDRNKGTRLVELISANRDPKLLAQLRAEALDPLLEMACWRSPGHAYSARILLGRIAGIEEKLLTEMVNKGQLQPIIDALSPR